jgi:hypothetical protein
MVMRTLDNIVGIDLDKPEMVDELIDRFPAFAKGCPFG